MAINFEKVNYQYSASDVFTYPALKDINVELPKNKIIAIIGHTGSGKSTFVQHLNALLLPKSGQVSVDEFVITNEKKNKKLKMLRKKVGLVFQFPEYQLFEETVALDIGFGPKNFQVEQKTIDEITKKVIVQVGLDETYLSRSPFDLSGGQKRRVAIAGILALDPDILVLDEPTAGLDPRGSEEIMKLILDFKEQGKTVIFVCHDLDAILKYADLCLVLNRGEATFFGTPSDLFENQTLCEENEIELPQIYQFINQLPETLKTKLQGIKDQDELIAKLVGELS